MFFMNCLEKWLVLRKIPNPELEVDGWYISFLTVQIPGAVSQSLKEYMWSDKRHQHTGWQKKKKNIAFLELYSVLIYLWHEH